MPAGAVSTRWPVAGISMFRSSSADRRRRRRSITGPEPRNR
ncbi:hypothetical protein ACPA9J_02250 [Pseudomonas aeruginosa]